MDQCFFYDMFTDNLTPVVWCEKLITGD